MQTIEALEIWLRGTVHGRLAMEQQAYLMRFYTLCVRAIDTPVNTPQHRALTMQMRQAKRDYDAWLDGLDAGRGIAVPRRTTEKLRAAAPGLRPIEAVAARGAANSRH